MLPFSNESTILLNKISAAKSNNAILFLPNFNTKIFSADFKIYVYNALT